MSPQKLQQCGQSATHDAMFSYSPAMIIAAMVMRNIKLITLGLILQESLLNDRHYVANRLKIGKKVAETFQNREQNYQHVGKCVTCHGMLFCCIAGASGHPIVGVRHRLDLNTDPLPHAHSYRPCTDRVMLRSSHTLQSCTPAMGRSKAPAMQEYHMRSSAM